MASGYDCIRLGGAHSCPVEGSIKAASHQCKALGISCSIPLAQARRHKAYTELSVFTQ